MILSNDTIMKPPYDITPKIISLIASISEKLGEVNANYLNKQSPQLRKQNRIKTIHSSLQIEGNTLTEEQITALIENQRVIGPEKDVLEVLNAIKLYEDLNQFDFHSEKSFLKAHLQLMKGLIHDAGKYRKQGVGIVKGDKVEHLAPPFETLISKTQHEYYAALALSDKSGKSTPFIEYMLDVIHQSLENLLNYNNRILKDTDRLEYFLSLGIKEFSRKDYMNTFKDISSATASRDLKKGIEENLFQSTGEKNKTRYFAR